jgi:S1-C subfamily serine protease
MKRSLLTSTSILAFIVFATAVLTTQAGVSSIYFGGIPDESIQEDTGVYLREVVRGSPAEEAGLRAGDMIVKVGRSSVHRTDDLLTALRSQPTGHPIEITYIRHGEENRTRVVLAPSW